MKTPETVLIAIECADDTVIIMAFVTCEYNNDGSPRWTREATAEEIEKEIGRMSVSIDKEKRPFRGWRRVERSEIPEDRTYRNALRHDGTKFHHDMAHARRLHLAELRHQREKKLEQLDRNWMRASGQGKQNDATIIEEKRQALRDFPVTMAARIERANTTDELKKVTLE